MHVLGAFLAGLLVATVTTPAGVSGAVLLLPVQVSVLGVPSPSVTPTNLIFNLFATPSGVLRYRRLRRGSVGSPLAIRLVAGTVPGVIVGAVIRVEWLSGQQAFYLAAAAVLATLGAMLVVRQPTPGRSADQAWRRAADRCLRRSRRRDLRDRRRILPGADPDPWGLHRLHGGARRAALNARRVHRRRRHLHRPGRYLGRLDPHRPRLGRRHRRGRRAASSAPTSARACNPASPSPCCGGCSAGSPS